MRGIGGKVRMKLKLLGHQSTEESFVKMTASPPVHRPKHSKSVSQSKSRSEISHSGCHSRYVNNDDFNVYSSNDEAFFFVLKLTIKRLKAG